MAMDCIVRQISSNANAHLHELSKIVLAFVEQKPHSVDMTKTKETTDGARGFGRLYQQRGVKRDEAVRYTVTAHPELSGYEDDIRRGWNAARAGR